MGSVNKFGLGLIRESYLWAGPLENSLLFWQLGTLEMMLPRRIRGGHYTSHYYPTKL